jgi:hypothetical protein
MHLVGMVVVRIAAVCLAMGGLHCGGVQSAAAQDPMKCERDPSCARGRASYVDCTKQCVDDPQCVELCGEVQQTTDGLGH